MASILRPDSDPTEPGPPSGSDSGIYSGLDFVSAYRMASQAIAKPLAVLMCGTGSATRAITVNAFMDVSYDPPTLAVAVYSDGRMGEALAQVNACTLSILNASQKQIAQWLGQPGQPSFGLLNNIDLAPTSGGEQVVAGALAWFAADIVARVPAATHDLLILQVVDCAEQAANPLESGTPAHLPLINWADRYWQTTPRTS